MQATLSQAAATDLTASRMSIPPGGGDPSKIKYTPHDSVSMTPVNRGSGSTKGLSEWGIPWKIIVFVGLVFAAGYGMYRWEYSAVKL